MNKIETITKKVSKEIISCIVLIGCIFAISYVFFNNGMPSGDDIHFHLSEIYDVYNAAINGLNPFGPNTIAMGNVAYNAHMFYAPLPHLFAGGLMYLFHNIGMTAVVAMKTTDIIFIAISGFYSYALGKRMTKSNIGGIILGIAYIFHPYRIFCMICRCAFSESIAISLIPVIFYGVYSLLNEKEIRIWHYISTIVGVTGIVLSHPFTALVTCLFAILYMLFNIKKLYFFIKDWKKDIYACVSIVLIVLFVLPYLLPMLEATRSDLYIVCDGEVMWTNLKHIQDSIASTNSFSGLLHLDWISGQLYYNLWNPLETVDSYEYSIAFYLFAIGLVITADELLDLTFLNKKSILLIEFFVLVLVSNLVYQPFEMCIAMFVFYVTFAYYKVTGGRRNLIVDDETKPIKLFKDIDLYYAIISIVLLGLLLYVPEVWSILPSIMYNAQFAWRVWSLFYFMCFFLVGVLLRYLKKVPAVTPVAIAGAALLIGVSQALPEKRNAYVYQPDSIWQNDSMEYDGVMKVWALGAQDEYLPKVFNDSSYKPEKYSNSLYYRVHSSLWSGKPRHGIDEYIQPVFLEGSGKLKVTRVKTPEVDFHVIISTEEAFIQIPQLYYDGYVVDIVKDENNFSLNSETTPEYVDGLVAFKVPEGEYDIKVHYEGTKSFRITIFGFFIGATGLLVLAAIDLFYFGQRNRKYINDINSFVSDKFYIR